MNLSGIVKQLRMCKFVDEIGHPLENNVAFIKLVEMAEQESQQCPVCCGNGVICKDEGESWMCEDCDGTGLNESNNAFR